MQGGRVRFQVRKVRAEEAGVGLRGGGVMGPVVDSACHVWVDSPQVLSHTTYQLSSCSNGISPTKSSTCCLLVVVLK